MKVAEWIEAHPGRAITVTLDSTLDQLVDLMLEQGGLRDLYVVDEKDGVIGHVTYQRLARMILAHHRPRHTRREIFQRVAGDSVRDLMNKHFPWARPDEQLDEVVGHMLDHGIEDLPVLDAQRHLLGAVNLGDVLRWERRE